MNHQAQIHFITANESRCSKFSRAVTGYIHDCQENWFSARPTALPPRASFIVLAWVLVQEVCSLPVIRACKTSRFCSETYWKTVRISLFLSPNRTQLKIKPHLRGTEWVKLGVSSKNSSNDVTRQFKEQDPVQLQFVILYTLHKHKSILLYRNGWKLLQNTTC